MVGSENGRVLIPPGLSSSSVDLEYLRSILSYNAETGVFHWLVARNSRAGQVTPGEVAGWVQGNRVKICVDQCEFMAHRLAWLFVYGEWPKNSLDHIDGNGINNRIANLRDVEHRHNMQNIRKAHKDSWSGLLGVSWHRHKQKWHSRLKIDGKDKHLGYFDDKNDAHQAYLAAKKLHHPFQTLT